MRAVRITSLKFTSSVCFDRIQIVAVVGRLRFGLHADAVERDVGGDDGVDRGRRQDAGDRRRAVDARPERRRRGLFGDEDDVVPVVGRHQGEERRAEVAERPGDSYQSVIGLLVVHCRVHARLR